jgi:hypothetical protein
MKSSGMENLPLLFGGKWPRCSHTLSEVREVSEDSGFCGPLPTKKRRRPCSLNLSGVVDLRRSRFKARGPSGRAKEAGGLLNTLDTRGAPYSRSADNPTRLR